MSIHSLEVNIFNSLRLLWLSPHLLYIELSHVTCMTYISTIDGVCCSFKNIILLGILVDFTYPSLEESVPSKPTAQMPLPSVEINENIELINDQDERVAPLNISAPVEPIAASKSDVLPIIQPVPVVKNVPQVCSLFLLTLLFLFF